MHSLNRFHGYSLKLSATMSRRCCACQTGGYRESYCPASRKNNGQTPNWHNSLNRQGMPMNCRGRYHCDCNENQDQKQTYSSNLPTVSTSYRNPIVRRNQPMHDNFHDHRSPSSIHPLPYKYVIRYAAQQSHFLHHRMVQHNEEWIWPVRKYHRGRYSYRPYDPHHTVGLQTTY